MKKLVYGALLFASMQVVAADPETSNKKVLLKDYPECARSINAECSAYVESLIAHAGSENNVIPNRRDFGDCRDDWSCDKEDLKNYLGKNRGDIIGRPAPTPIPEPNTATVFLLGASLLVGGRALKRRNQN